MQVVIDIPKEKYEWIMRHLTLDLNFKDCKITPLPEHHSDLIERSSLDVDNLDGAYDSNFELDLGRLYTIDVVNMIEEAPTIIPATKEKSCKNCEHGFDSEDCYKCDKNIQNTCEPKQTATKEGEVEKRKPCINYEDGCEEWAGCPCVHYKAESGEV